MLVAPTAGTFIHPDECNENLRRRAHNRVTAEADDKAKGRPCCATGHFCPYCHQLGSPTMIDAGCTVPSVAEIYID